MFITGYVIMPEHVHLLVSEPERATLAAALQALKQSVSRRLIGRREQFLEGRLLRLQTCGARVSASRSCGIYIAIR